MSAEDLAKVFRIFKLNAWDFKEGGALFKLGSKFPHQCVSNNTFYHANDDNGRGEHRAVRDIAKVGWCQGLSFVHFSVQTEPFW